MTSDITWGCGDIYWVHHSQLVKGKKKKHYHLVHYPGAAVSLLQSPLQFSH